MTAAAPLDPSSWGRLLVLAPNWIGDAVMAEPSMRALHAAYPDLQILAFGRTAAIASWMGHPAISLAAPHDDRGLWGPFRAGRKLATLEPDAVLLLRGSFRAALIARATGCRIRIGVDRDGRRALLSHPIARPDRDGKPRSTTELYEALVAPLGVTVTAPLPRITPLPNLVEKAAEMLKGLPRPVLGLVPGGSKIAKRWSPDRFAAVVEACGDRIGSAVVFGSPAEREVADAVIAARRSGPRIVDLGRLGLDPFNLPAAIGACDLLVTNDTGPRHLAIAQGVPTVSLFGPTDHRWTIVPGARERMLLAEPFLDDDHIADRHPEACRIDRIPVGDVVHAVVSLLDARDRTREVSSTS